MGQYPKVAPAPFGTAPSWGFFISTGGAKLKNAGLEQVIELLEKCRERNRFTTITVKVRNHQYVHIDANATEATAIKQECKK